MGLLALVPVAGPPVSLTVEVLVVQVLSTSIASRVAYSYGYDAKDPAERAFIDRLVRRSFVSQAARAGPIREVGQSAAAVAHRVNRSEKLLADHRLLAALKSLMTRLGPAGGRVSVQSRAEVLRPSAS